ncbi:MAG: hypothetical protein EBZ89_10925 [Chloroflexi bacterium]|nr:hypothetical protein [Chloroflexota bacterium]
MRILHTSDLHVGRTLNNISFLEDQKVVLGQIADIARARMAGARTRRPGMSPTKRVTRTPLP